MATELRRDRRERQKRQRHRQQQQQHRRRGSGGLGNQLIIGGVIVGAIAIAIVGLRAAGVLEPPAAAIDLNAAQFQIPPGTTIGTLQESEGATHIPTSATATYRTIPPTSGEHWSSTSPAAPVSWGIKDAMLRNEQTVHNLEHGGIVIAYSNLTPAEVDQLKSTVRALMNGAYRKIILQPYPPLTDAKVALTAWRWLHKLQTVDQVQIVQFVRQHYADGNYAPEANVP